MLHYSRIRMMKTLHLLHDVFHFILLTVQDHPPLLLVLQVLEQRAVGLVLPLVLQIPHVDGGHLPLPLRCCVQNNLQRRQAWRRNTPRLASDKHLEIKEPAYIYMDRLPFFVLHLSFHILFTLRPT